MQHLLTTRLLLSLLLLSLLSILVNAQPGMSKSDSLLRELKISRPDTNRVNLLVELGHFYVFKPGEEANDLDSSILLARQAEALSLSLHYIKGQGNSYTVLSQSTREKGDTATGRQYAEKAIQLLETTLAKADLARALKERTMYLAPWPDDIKEKVFYE